MNSHLFAISNFKDPYFWIPVDTHFNTDNHSVSDFSFMSTDIVADVMENC